MEEKANRTTKKKVRHEANGKVVREAHVLGGSKSYCPFSVKDRQVGISVTD